jgi:ectoine hydroxylase-related dioxygenase (phytanoyl-CoA dioxygenase family)
LAKFDSQNIGAPVCNRVLNKQKGKYGCKPALRDCQQMNTNQILQDYERDGVVRIEKFFSNEETRQVRCEIERYIRDVAPKLDANEVTFESDGKTARNLWRMEKHDPFFAEIARKPEILNLVHELVHGEPVLLGAETFNKPARIGSGVPPHQDNAYFCQTPPDVLTIWIAMDAATEANGPVSYACGSHKLGVLPHKASRVKGNSMGLAENFNHSDPFIGILEPGDALIHHCQTIHYSGPNRTDFPRCGFLLVYRGAQTQTDSALKAAYDSARASASNQN